MQTAVDLNQDRAALLELDLRVHRPPSDAERVEGPQHVLDHRTELRLRIELKEAHAEVDDGGAVGLALVVLPDSDDLVDAVSGDRVDDVLIAAEVPANQGKW